MEKSSPVYGEMESHRRIVALESALELALKIIKDIAYHNRHNDREYLNLVTEYVALTSGTLRDDE
jgi:hypothetical protein